MKHIIALSLTIFCTQHILFSMDPVTPASESEIVATISNTINAKYSSNPNHYFSGIANQLTVLAPEACLDIMQITVKHYPTNITTTTYNTLYEQNVFFAKAVGYYVARARENLDMITAHNIAIIENPNKQQPVSALNALSSSLKTFVMNRALQEVKHKYAYDILLAGQHVENIHAFDICEITDQAVTSSYFQEIFSGQYISAQFLLWDLKTGKSIRTFEEPSPINILAFNPNGSCIAAALDNENAIKIWCPKTGNLLHKLYTNHNIDCLSYSHPTGSILTAIYGINNTAQAIITQWSLTTEDNKAGNLVNNFRVFGGRQKNSWFTGNKYYAAHPVSYLTAPNDALYVRKTNCIPLYLCMKAIEKTKNGVKLDSITGTTSFGNLTEIEQKKVHNAIQQKSATSKT